MYPKALLSEKIAASILTAIKTGFYKPGEQIPNEIQLSEELGVSRATLREALKSLVSQNVLEVRRGIGTFVSELPNETDDGLDFHDMELSHQINDILSVVKQMGRSELNLYPHLSWQSQEAIMALLKTEWQTVQEGIALVFNAIEKMAEGRHGLFKRRMLKIGHESFIKAVGSHLEFKDALFEAQYLQFVENIGGSDFYYEALLDRAMIIHREVS